MGPRQDYRWKLTEGIGCLPRVHRELAEGIGGFSRVRWKLAEGIRSLLGVHRELAKMALGVRRKKTKKLIGRSSGVDENLTDSHEGLIGLDGLMIVID
ncbi:hypothetical protein BHE74_00044599 [Ensete ventricosum]|nr:hypothetical protein BHE74_00044599 [Ensete ventricosum]